MADPKSGTTMNSDVFSLSRRINRFILEILKSQSSGVSQTMPFDIVRVKSYTASLRGFIAWVVSQPLLDLPETGPQSMDLPVPPVLPLLENESAYDLCVLFDLLREELVNSQSSRLPTNLMKYDHDRALAIISKIDAFVDSYIEVSEPLDLPESSPMRGMTGKGALGV